MAFLFGALLAIAGIASLVCFVLVLVAMFKNDQSGLGIACILLTICTGIGPLIAFIFGWMKSTEWDLKKIMMAWTLCWVLQVVFAIGFVVMGGMAAAEMGQQMQNQMQMEFDNMENNGLDVEFGAPNGFGGDGEVNFDFDAQPVEEGANP